MTNHSDKIVTLVLVYRTTKEPFEEEYKLTLTCNQAEDIQSMYKNPTSPRVMCFGTDATGNSFGVDVGPASGLKTLFIQD